ncbi:unnamed protein product, partial [Nesidiocoris tenuis]
MGFCFPEIVSWYQKKIGTYDKQEWEKTVEQRILSGFTHVPKKTAKLKTDLIDVDLVRGSSFTKAKPKHGIMTVIRLGCMRLLFLPFYRKWWCHQTSAKLFLGLLLLYILQVSNVCIFIYVSYCVAYSGGDQPAQPKLLTRRRGSQQALHLPVNGGSGAAPIRGGESSYNSSDDGETTGSFCPALTEGTTSAAEWIGITTNSDDCSVSSEIDEQPFASEFYS